LFAGEAGGKDRGEPANVIMPCHSVASWLVMWWTGLARENSLSKVARNRLWRAMGLVWARGCPREVRAQKE